MQTETFSKADITRAKAEGYRHGQTDRRFGLKPWKEAWTEEFRTPYARAYAVAYTQGYAETDPT